MRQDDVRRDGQIKKSAFLPRMNGSDPDGLSVSIEDSKYRELHRAKFTGPGKTTGKISVEALRNLGLDVVPDPQADDPRHTLITGLPDRTLGTAENLEATRLAGELAKMASVYVFPISTPNAENTADVSPSAFT
jgi:hypothetical protein